MSRGVPKCILQAHVAAFSVRVDAGGNLVTVLGVKESEVQILSPRQISTICRKNSANAADGGFVSHQCPSYFASASRSMADRRSAAVACAYLWVISSVE
jgi:hypothetical protein